MLLTQDSGTYLHLAGCCAGGYTSCDGVPDPDANPLAAASISAKGRRLQSVTRWVRRQVKPCNRNSCCTKRSAGIKYGCLPCKSGCQEGRTLFAHVVSTKDSKCQCQVWGSCPFWFNKNCRYKKPMRR